MWPCDLKEINKCVHHIKVKLCDFVFQLSIALDFDKVTHPVALPAFDETPDKNPLTIMGWGYNIVSSCIEQCTPNARTTCLTAVFQCLMCRCVWTDLVKIVYICKKIIARYFN